MTTGQMLPPAVDFDFLGLECFKTCCEATINSCRHPIGEKLFDGSLSTAKATPPALQSVLLREQSVVLHKFSPDEMVKAFEQTSADVGMRAFQISEAHQDFRNLTTAISGVKTLGKEACYEICSMTSPAHTIATSVRFAYALKENGCDLPPTKDMAGVITHGFSANLFRQITNRNRSSTHAAQPPYYRPCGRCVPYHERSEFGIRRNFDQPLAKGTSRPNNLPMLCLFGNNSPQPNYNRATSPRFCNCFIKVDEDLASITLAQAKSLKATLSFLNDEAAFFFNFRAQFKGFHMDERINEVLAENPYACECLGCPPLVHFHSPNRRLSNSAECQIQKADTPAVENITLSKFGRTTGILDTDALATAKQTPAKDRSPLAEQIHLLCGWPNWKGSLIKRKSARDQRSGRALRDVFTKILQAHTRKNSPISQPMKFP